jgi:hypothetical protein
MSKAKAISYNINKTRKKYRYLTIFSRNFKAHFPHVKNLTFHSFPNRKAGEETTLLFCTMAGNGFTFHFDPS